MKPPPPSRDLPATSTVECSSVAGRWRMETGGALDWMQDSLVAFGVFGILSLALVVVLMTVLPQPARSWTAGGFLVLVAWWALKLFQRARRAARVLMEADGAQVVIGGES